MPSRGGLGLHYWHDVPCFLSVVVNHPVTELRHKDHKNPSTIVLLVDFPPLDVLVAVFVSFACDLKKVFDCDSENHCCPGWLVHVSHLWEFRLLVERDAVFDNEQWYTISADVVTKLAHVILGFFGPALAG